MLATTFGAGPSLDAYYAAFRVPDFVFNLLVLGALSAGFIPVFSAYLAGSKEKAWRLAQSVLLLLGISLIVVSGIIYIFAPWLIPLITPGFAPEVMQDTVGLTRIMLISPILLGISGVFGGVLQSFKRFLAYSLAPIFYNIGIIFGIFVLIKPFGLNGLAWGVVLGAGLHLLMQLFVAMRLGWKWTLHRFWKGEGIREIMHLMGPRTVALGITQVNFIIITVIASGLMEGSLSIFNFAYNLANVPVGLFGISFAVAAFPVLSEYYSKRDEDAFKKTIFKTTSQILFFLVPTMVVIALLDEQIVRLVYGAGEFDWASTLVTAKALLYFIPGIFAQALLPLLSRAFYAQKNTRHPLYAAIVSLIATGVLGVYFSKAFGQEGVVGLALAFSLASFLQLILLIFWQHLKFAKESNGVVRTIKETIVASGGMIVAIQVVKEFIGPYLDLLTVKGVLVHFLLPAAIGGLTYLIVLKLLKSEDYLSFETSIKSKFSSFSNTFLPVVGRGEEDDLL